MIRYKADWVLPIADRPIRDGWVALDRGRVASVGSGGHEEAIDLGRTAIMPSLVNAHTHLELSYLRGVVPRASQFIDWIRVLMEARRQFPNPSDPIIIGAAVDAIEEAQASGTGLVGDISNTLVTVPLLRERKLAAHVFYELLGFNTPDPRKRVADARSQARAASADEWARVSLAPHAPYSVSPGLFAAIRADLDEQPARRSSVHLGESVEELEFLKDGRGAWRTLLEQLGVWTDAWNPPGASPVEYLADLGFLDSRVLVVHGVQFSGEDLARLRALAATVVSCPRSNRYVGVGDPPVESFYAMGVNVAFGTDSLASVDDLNMFAELAAARALAPRVPARALLESATLCGAQALGFERDFGSIEPGKRASLIGVTVPEAVSDVEEYLVNGIEPGAIKWLDPETPNSQ